MTAKTRDEKLTTIEVQLKRWMTRGFRAQRAIDKLLKRRRRLLKIEEAKPVIHVIPGISPSAEAVVKDPLKLPDFLDRSDPLVAETMTAKRKAEEAEQRKAMPLSGRDAMAAIRRPKKRSNR